jgi:hypothetical protein
MLRKDYLDRFSEQFEAYVQIADIVIFHQIVPAKFVGDHQLVQNRVDLVVGCQQALEV